MKTEFDDIARQKETIIVYSFDQEKDKLTIKAESQKITYCGSLEPNPLITFDKIKKVIAAQNYQIISIDHQILQITIGGMIDLELKNEDQLNLELLKEAVQKLNSKFEEQAQKNTQFQSIINALQNQISSIKQMKEQQQAAQNEKNLTLESRIGENKLQFDSYSNTQKQIIEKVQQQLLQLRDDCGKQKESIDENDSKIALNYQEFKESITVNSSKLQELVAGQSKIKNQFETKQKENDQQVKKILLKISSIEQQIQKTSKSIEVLQNQLNSNDKKQSQYSTQLRKLIATNQLKLELKTNTNQQSIDQHSAQFIRQTKKHDELKNQVLQLKNLTSQNKTNLQSNHKQKTQNISNLTGQLTQLKTHFDQFRKQTIPKLPPYPVEFLENSKVVCTHKEKRITAQFFNNQPGNEVRRLTESL